MFRILIVEDMEEDAHLLKDFVAKRLTEAQVELAQNVQEGREMIQRARKDGRLYDAVILDFLLPGSAGEHEEIDESLCSDIGLLMPDAVVVHLTAFMKDEKVQEHMKLQHAQRVDKSAGFSKLDINFPQLLVGCLKKYLYGARVETKLKKLAPHADEPAPHADEPGYASRARRNRASPIEGSLTHEVASLQREIAAHWDDYDERLKAKIKRVFQVTRHGDGWIITIL